MHLHTNVKPSLWNVAVFISTEQNGSYVIRQNNIKQKTCIYSLIKWQKLFGQTNITFQKVLRNDVSTIEISTILQFRSYRLLSSTVDFDHGSNIIVLQKQLDLRAKQNEHKEVPTSALNCRSHKNSLSKIETVPARERATCRKKGWLTRWKSAVHAAYPIGPPTWPWQGFCQGLYP